MYILGVVLARAGSKGLPDKCARPLLGRAVIEYTFDHALAAQKLTRVVLTTDSKAAANLARARGITVIDRPAALAHDTVRVDTVARHAVEHMESTGEPAVDVVVFLYGNIPVRAPGIIDHAVAHLSKTGADSVRTVALVTKQHPDWIHHLTGDRLEPFRENGIYRRQDLQPLYYHDGAVAVVRRNALFNAAACGNHGQAFLGNDRRAIVQSAEDAVDIDTLVDLHFAEAVLRYRESPNDRRWDSNRLASTT